MNILITETESWERAFFEKALTGHALMFWPSPLTADHLPEARDAEIMAVFVGSHLTRTVIDAFPKLQHIATRSTGFDHIDLLATTERGISVSNVPTYGEHTVAEYTFALLLELSRKVGAAHDQVMSHGMFTTDEAFRGFDLHGRTITVVGTGRIGKNVALIAKGFGMKVLCCDSRPNDELCQQGFAYCAFDEALPYSDVLTFHVPVLATTIHLLNKDRVSRLKPGAFIINTSRGAVIDTNALIWGLKQGIIAGAGLDVLEEEGLLKHDEELALLASDHPNPEQLRLVLEDQYLIDHPNVIITPHNAFNTSEALQRIAQTTLENIQAFLAGKAQNVVR